MNKNKQISYEEILFDGFLTDLTWICSDFPVKTEFDFEMLKRKFENTNLPPYIVKDRFRRGYKAGSLNFSQISDGRVAYLSRCLGHTVSKKNFFKYPKLCVLYSFSILKDRWKDAEEVISSNDDSAYLYSKYVVSGRLPEKMHTEIVMRSFVSKSFSIRKYFSEI